MRFVGADAHTGDLLDELGRRARRVVGNEEPISPSRLQVVQQFLDAGQGFLSNINNAVHVQQNGANLFQICCLCHEWTLRSFQRVRQSTTPTGGVRQQSTPLIPCSVGAAPQILHIELQRASTLPFVDFEMKSDIDQAAIVQA